MKRLIAIQQGLRVAKDKMAKVTTKSGGSYTYSYRDAEQILEAVKPLLEKQQCAVICRAEYVTVDTEIYKRVRATLYGADGKEIAFADDMVRAPHATDRMTEQQMSGCDTTYCKRYALQNLFAIDNGDDDYDSNSNPLSYQNRQQAQAAPQPAKPITKKPAAAPAPAKKPAQPKSGLDAVTTAIQMQEKQMKLDALYKSGAIKDDLYLAKQKELNEHGRKIGCTYTDGEGWVSNNDLFAE